jgi:hypothetical protein
MFNRFVSVTMEIRFWEYVNKEGPIPTRNPELAYSVENMYVYNNHRQCKICTNERQKKRITGLVI